MLYQITRTTNGKTELQNSHFTQAAARSALSDLAGYMKRQGAEIVVQSEDSFTMTKSKLVTKYDVMPVE